MKTKTVTNIISVFALFANFRINTNELIYRLKTYKSNFFVRFNDSPYLYTKNELINDLSLPFAHKNRAFLIDEISEAIRTNKIDVL